VLWRELTKPLLGDRESLLESSWVDVCLRPDACDYKRVAEAHVENARGASPGARPELAKLCTSHSTAVWTAERGADDTQFLHDVVDCNALSRLERSALGLSPRVKHYRQLY